MKLGSRRLKAIVLIVVSVMLCVALYTYSRGFGRKSEVSAEAKQELTLTRPGWTGAIVAGATSIEQEAGIAIWLNATANSPLNLDAARSLMNNNLENDTSDYVIGSLKWTGIPSSDDYPHCFVSKSGWIVVYYLKVNEQAVDQTITGWIGKIIDWQYYSSSTKHLTNNLLQKGLETICSALGVAPLITNAKYCHFQYPSATNLLIAIKGGASTSFNLFIPTTVNIYEASWSLDDESSTGHLSIDGSEFYHGQHRHYGYPKLVLSSGWHSVSVSGDWGSTTYCCILLLYS